ncbi:S-layer homology domain-containing protein [Paenibacillus glycanilyticus]|uniref:S-layer homology domain-containing protein n=1 Tax=Paenibacillus glycanilyticus TaxID=126569 RepID=UPI00203E10FC|nr:S-layer homology domain-containing protein [Paenibacillus glycanilyticus]MCM3630872.1 S-layer homology domain-containing protein [Paenibacillus glycanilyticus]
MKFNKQARIIFPMVLSASILSTGLAVPTPKAAAADAGAAQDQGQGQWLTGEFHAHTFESDDAQSSLESVLDHGLTTYGLDFLMLADHLRSSKRDDTGAEIPGGPIPLSKGLLEYQVPKIKALQEAGKYAGKTIFSGFEWDIPSHEHGSVGILTDEPGSAAALKAANQFEYLFTNRDATWFNPADVLQWEAADDRAYSTHADSLSAINWLKRNYPETSYMIVNHPSRGVGKYKISDFRDFNNAAPDIAFGFEGMLGNQMEPDRGGYNSAYDPANPTANDNYKNRSYGGVDYMVAKVGGVWDSLLGEGRKFWNFANSDYHFKTIDTNSSGYWPGEYAKNYIWSEGRSTQDILNGMRSGKSFSVFGDLINALDFRVADGGADAEMGESLQATEGDKLTLTIKFKSPGSNNYENPIYSGQSAGAKPAVDHIDLIAGDVTGPAVKGTPAYDKDTNDSTRVLATFTSEDWTTDANGYNVITYDLPKASKDQYFRLRGTNLGMNVAGETLDGNPLIDPKTTTADATARFNEINDRNYKDLWFYSNPVFVDTAAYTDEEAVKDTLSKLTLGNADAVTENIVLPSEGEHGAAIAWEETTDTSNAVTIENGIAKVTRPAAGHPNASVTLKATASRGDSSDSKAFAITIKALPSTSTPGGGTPPVTTPATSVSVTVDPAKGAEGSLKDVISFKIPAGALTSNGTVGAQVLPSGQQPPLGNLQALSPIVEMTSNAGTTFGKPVELTFNYAISSAAPTSQPAVYYYNEKLKKWIFLGGKANGTTITVDIKHFTKFGVFGYMPHTFSDLTASWAKPYAERLIGMGVISGYEDGKFRPDQPVTRAEWVKLLADSLGLPAASGATSFADDSLIPSWAKAQVKAATDAGYVTGFDTKDGSVFNASQRITRAEIAVIAARVLKTAGTSPSGTGKAFSDVSAIPAWALDAVNQTSASGIVSGYPDGSFRPDDTLTRAEAVKIAYALLDALNI